MRVLFDVTHPALVHLFKHPLWELADRGHAVAVASREKDVTARLLDAYGLPHVPVSSAGESPLSRAAELVERTRALRRVARAFDPDVVVSQVDPAAPQAARHAGARSVVFDDSEAEWLAGALTHPRADVVCTPAAFDRDLGAVQRRYDGFHELAYLHPDRFSPSRERLREYGVDPDEPYAVVRFVSWTAYHDAGRDGLSPTAKRRLVRELSAHGRVYVSSESPLPPGLGDRGLPVPPEALHDLLAFADVYAGDSQTMATEAAVLGTPAVRSNAFAGDGDMSNFRELENRYGLVRSVTDEDDAVATAVAFARDSPSERFARRRRRLLAETEDVAAFVVDVVEAEGSA
jgi:predicted glycosyltransferase